jgi:hypothetical protein
VEECRQETLWGAEEEPRLLLNTKPEQDGVRNVGWERNHHCQKARQQHHRQKAEGGKGQGMQEDRVAS